MGVERLKICLGAFYPTTEFCHQLATFCYCKQKNYYIDHPVGRSSRQSNHFGHKNIDVQRLIHFNRNVPINVNVVNVVNVTVPYRFPLRPAKVGPKLSPSKVVNDDFELLQTKKFRSFGRGGGGQVVNVLAFYSDCPSSNLAEAYRFFCNIFVFENNKN